MRGTVSGNVGKIYKAEFVRDFFLLSFSVAESVYMGQNKEKLTCWHKCDYWGKAAEGLTKYLEVGQHVDVFGQAYLSEYEKDGVTQKSMVVKVNDIVLGHKPTSVSPGGPQPQQSQVPPTAQPLQQPPPATSGPGNMGVPDNLW